MSGRVLALALIITMLAPTAGLAQRGGGGGGGSHGGGGGGGAPRGGGGAPGGGAPRTNAPPPRAPGPQAGQPSGGFDFSHDIGAPAQPVSPSRPPVTAPNRPATIITPSRPMGSGYDPPTGNGYHPPSGNNDTRPAPHVVLNNPAFHGRPAWNWNRGVMWQPAPRYWGGGFWGPFAFGLAAAAIGAALYGTFLDPATNEYVTSYQVAEGSPGATLLENYQLTQTPCGPPNLVVIFGPDENGGDDSVICAYPNNLVGPGEYDVDPSTLTLVSQ